MTTTQEAMFHTNSIDTEVQNTQAFVNWKYRMRNYKNGPRIDCVDSDIGSNGDAGTGESE